MSSHAPKNHQMILAQLVAEGSPLPIIPAEVRYAAIMLASPAPICLRPFWRPQVRPCRTRRAT